MRLILVTILLIAGCSAAVDTAKYKKALKNKKKLKSLYREKNPDLPLTNERLESFREALEFVVNSNEDPDCVGPSMTALHNDGPSFQRLCKQLSLDITWESDVNFFAPKTKAERSDILLKPETSNNGFDYSQLTFPLGDNGVASIDWVEKGYVREVEDQTTDCRACWAFAALVSFEGRYQLITGDEVDFSEQELVDCVYWAKGRDEDGCYGGHMADVYKFIAKFGQLASSEDASYTHSVGTCSYNSISNSLTGAYIDEEEPFIQLSYEDQVIIDNLLEGPITTAVQTTEAFLFYSSGVFRDNTCENLIPNHAVGLVGYDATSFRVKNSWGKEWGDNGYMNVARGFHGCGIVFYNLIPNLKSGAPTTKDIEQPPACSDQWDSSYCELYINYCSYYTTWCRKTCNAC